MGSKELRHSKEAMRNCAGADAEVGRAQKTGCAAIILSGMSNSVDDMRNSLDSKHSSANDIASSTSGMRLKLIYARTLMCIPLLAALIKLSSRRHRIEQCSRNMRLLGLRIGLDLSANG